MDSSPDGQLSKRGLWRYRQSHTNDTYSDLNDTYSLLNDKGTFMGMIETGEFVANGAAIKIKLIIRGFARVPVWWFNYNDFKTRNHSLMGPFFTFNHSQSRFFKVKENENPHMNINWLTSVDERSKTEKSLIDCFFNL